MPETEPEVSPLALSILQLLDERPMHPYELASTMRDRHHDEFIRLNFGSLYHTVEVLERNGWILPAEREKEGRRPERTIYRLTTSGRVAGCDLRVVHDPARPDDGARSDPGDAHWPQLVARSEPVGRRRVHAGICGAADLSRPARRLVWPAQPFRGRPSHFHPRLRLM